MFKREDRVKVINLTDVDINYWKINFNDFGFVKSIRKDGKYIVDFNGKEVPMYENQLELVEPEPDKLQKICIKSNTDDAIDSLNYTIQVLGNFNNIKENNMKILELYEKRKREEIVNECNNKIDEIEEFDSIQSLINETENQLNVLLGRKEDDRVFLDIMNIQDDELYDDISLAKIEEANNTTENKIKELVKLIEEVEALLSMTNDYDEQIKILKKYNILNKDGKLNV